MNPKVNEKVEHVLTYVKKAIFDVAKSYGSEAEEPIGKEITFELEGTGLGLQIIVALVPMDGVREEDDTCPPDLFTDGTTFLN